MNVKAIALSAFFISVFLLYQIRFIVRLKKLKKMRENVKGEDFVFGAYFDVCGCCCNPRCLMDDFECDICEACTTSETETKQSEKRADRQSDAAERKNTEKRLRVQKEYLAEIEQEKLGRKEKVEALRANGYIATDYERNKVIDTVSVNPKTGLKWTSNVARLPIEKIIIIIENEQDFEIVDEYIINKKEILEKEKTLEIICSVCGNPIKSGAVFCPNCGTEL